MKTYDYSEAQQNFSSILNLALTQDIIIKEKNGRRFRITPVKDVVNKSPFEYISGINTDMTTEEIIEFMKQSRSYKYAL